MNRTDLGRFGEDIAVRYLETTGLTVVERNWRCRAGEIDIIARDDETGGQVFCEVKARSGQAFGDPLEAVTREKLQRLRVLVGQWLSGHPGAPWVRLDAIALVLGRSEFWLRHVRGLA